MKNRINRKHAAVIRRISWITAGSLFFGTIMINWVTLLIKDKPPEIIQAQPMSSRVQDINYPVFHDFISKRGEPFGYKIITLHQRRFEKMEMPEAVDEVIDDTPALSQIEIDSSGLSLVGTLPGTSSSWAIIEDSRTGKTVVRKQGDEIRGSKLEEVNTDHIVLTLEDRRESIFIKSLWKQELNTKPFSSLSGKIMPGEASLASGPAVPREIKPKKKRKLGISVKSINYMRQKELGLDSGGLEISSCRRTDVEIKKGDIVVAINGKSPGSLSKAMDMIRNTKADKISLTIIREGNKVNIDVPFQ